MKKNTIAMIMTAALATLAIAGCTPDTTEAEAEVTYKVVGGISEPTRVWNETAEVVTEAPVEETTEEAYEPTVYSMEPQLFVTNKTAELLTSDKDWEVTGNVEEGTELTLVGYTGKGYYQAEDGAFISASDVEKVVVAEEEAVEEVAQTSTTTTTQTPATQQTPAATEQPAEQSQPAQEQTYEEPQQVAEQPVQEEQPTQNYEEPAQTDTVWDENNPDTVDNYFDNPSACPHAHTWTGESCNLATGEITIVTICFDCGATL